MTPKADPLVTICMPAYNVGQFLHQALASVLAQTYERIEVVVVDDGSTDQTSDVAQSFHDDRIRYVRNERNIGGYQTMNKAVRLAQGELVAIYHSDDVYDSTIVEKEVGYLESHPEAGAVFCLDHYIDDTGQIIGGTTFPAELARQQSLGYEDVFPFLLRNKNILIRCPTFMARREALDAVGPFDAERYDIAADLDMWIRIIRRFPVGVLNERLMYYRAGRNQWSTRYNYLRTDPEWFFLIMDRYISEDGWQDRLSRADLNEYAFHRCDDETFRAMNHMLKGDRLQATKLLRNGYAWSALRQGPNARKVRLLLLRMMLYVGLYLLSEDQLKRSLHRLAYRGRFLPWQPQAG